jgi:hypothetical protein
LDAAVRGSGSREGRENRPRALLAVASAAVLCGLWHSTWYSDSEPLAKP